MTYIVRLTWRESLQDRALNSLEWTSFFDQELYLQRRVNDLEIVHHVYLTSPTNSGPLFVMHHGAGSSGLSFANCAAEIRKILPNAGILSADARDHGSTSVKRASEDGEADPETARLDLNLDTLNQDLLFVIRETQAKMGWETLPDIVLVGHSLGGAVITDVAKKGELGGKLLAYAVLDVVEGRFHLFLVQDTDAHAEHRFGNGCPPEHGDIPLNSAIPLPLPSFRDRMAVCPCTLDDNRHLL
jgi:pimeloyl-ACP methyl ester carboxylesterase